MGSKHASLVKWGVYTLIPQTEYRFLVFSRLTADLNHLEEGIGRFYVHRLPFFVEVSALVTLCYSLQLEQPEQTHLIT